MYVGRRFRAEEEGYGLRSGGWVEFEDRDSENRWSM